MECEPPSCEEGRSSSIAFLRRCQVGFPDAAGFLEVSKRSVLYAAMTTFPYMQPRDLTISAAKWSRVLSFFLACLLACLRRKYFGARNVWKCRIRSCLQKVDIGCSDLIQLEESSI